MRLALAQARAALDTGDVPVGAVVLDRSGSVVGTGRNAREATGDPTAHAEILALRHAAATMSQGWRLAGTTLLVTLEPCPMCAGAVLAARVSRLVFGAYDERAGAVGSTWDLVRDRQVAVRPEVIGGVLAEPCGALLLDFFAGHRQPGTAALGRPAKPDADRPGAG